MVASDVVLAHSSDIHVDDDLGIGGLTGLQALAGVVATAGAAGADVLLLAGDTFDNARISARVLAQARAVLAAAAMPVVMLPGNHDPAGEASIFHRAGLCGLPDLHVLGVTTCGPVLLAGGALEILGCAHRSFDDMAPLRAATGARHARWRVVMAHGHYVAAADRAREAHRAWKFGDDELAAAAADYVALGHWDRHVRVGDARSLAFYAGAPDLAGSLNLVRLGGDGGVAVGRHALAAA